MYKREQAGIIQINIICISSLKVVSLIEYLYEQTEEIVLKRELRDKE